MDYAIRTTSLTKTYGSICAVDAVDLRVRRGEIYGFLGLNGAGKTTTIRALLGMIKPSRGTVEVLGETVHSGGTGPWHRVGHLVETPGIYPELTVRDHLEIARRLHGMGARSPIKAVLEQLNLGRYADRKAGALSMGNLQRLGLARALLHRPTLLILDEPANGLDPAGVVEIRALLHHLTTEEGATIFMSSHILTEVDRLATRIGIIHRGRLIEELDASQLEHLRSRRLEIRSRDLDAAARLLLNANYTMTVDTEDARITVSDARAIRAPDEVAQLLVHGGAPPLRLAIVQENLEEHFLQLTGVNA